LVISKPESNKLDVDKFSKKLFEALLSIDIPILGILREGEFLLDVRTLFESDLNQVAESVRKCIDKI